MKTLVLYDSLYGNTEKIAQAIGEGLGGNDISLKRITNAQVEDLKGMELVLVGSPTHGGKASQATRQFFDKIPTNALENINTAAFDTSMTKEDQSVFLRFIIKFFGYAAQNIAKTLSSKGAKVLAAETFFVLGKEGPLLKGELERAEKWGEEIVKTYS